MSRRLVYITDTKYNGAHAALGRITQQTAATSEEAGNY